MNSDFWKQIGKLTDEETAFINKWRTLTDEEKEKYLNLIRKETNEPENNE